MSEHTEGTAPVRRSLGSLARWSAVGSAGAVVITAVRMKLIALLLGPAGVGLVSEIVQISGLLLVPAGLVTGAAFLTAISKASSPEESRRVVHTARTALVSLGLGSAALAAGIGFITPFAGGRYLTAGLLVLGVGGAATTAAVNLRTSALLGIGRVAQQAKLAIAFALFVALGTVAGALAKGVLGMFAGAWIAALVGIFATAPIVAAWVGGFEPIIAPLFDREFVRHALRIGVSSLVAGLAVQGALTWIRLVLDHYQGKAATGQFQAAYGIDTSYVGLLLQSVANVVFPAFAAAESEAKIEAIFDEATTLLIKIVPGIVILGIALRSIAVRVMYSSEFGPASMVLGYELAGDLAKSIAWMCTGLVLFRGQVKAYLVLEVGASLILAALVTIGVRYWGLTGAGVGFGVSYLAYALLGLWTVWRVVAVRIPPHIPFALVAFTSLATLLVRASDGSVTANALAAVLGSGTLAFGLISSQRFRQSRERSDSPVE